MRRFVFIFICLVWIMSACTSRSPLADDPGGPKVIVVETFLADIVQNIAGEQLVVETLMPSGVDPHSYQPTPRDVARIAESDLLILNQTGLEGALDDVILNAGGDFILVEAAAGLAARQPDDEETGLVGHDDEHSDEIDPHFWLNPVNVITYVENITAALSKVDPDGASEYERNAAAYIEELKQLDSWISTEVEKIPEDRRLLVTNHESLGYFADRYGFRVVGAIIPSVTTGASPSAQDLVALTRLIQETGSPAIFLETGTNSHLAEQLAIETGIKIAPRLYSHSTNEGNGPASTYVDMMRYNTTVIVEALR
jgi:manganese/iron transport system substrate-binding protein